MAFQTLNGKQIREQSIETRHIKGLLAESVLGIDWTSAEHAKDILQNKELVDYVDYPGYIEVVEGESSIQLSLPLNDSENAMPGVILNDQQVVFVFEKDCPDEDVVLGKITENLGFDEDTQKYTYTVEFFTADDEPYEFVEDCKFKLMYPIKTNLWDIDEDFISRLVCKHPIMGIADLDFTEIKLANAFDMVDNKLVISYTNGEEEEIDLTVSWDNIADKPNVVKAVELSEGKLLVTHDDDTEVELDVVPSTIKLGANEW